MINVSHIERFATHDGPGIRTTVFLKGCPLHCPWCANPETWSQQPVLLHDARKCTSCRRCSAVCSVQAITFPDGTFHHDRAVCRHCGSCVKACLNEALVLNGHPMTPEEILSEVLKDRLYYEESSGGLTVSGGEPLLQEETAVLLQLAQNAGLHTAAETTGNVPVKQFQTAAESLDLFLFDVKQIHADTLHAVTGADPALIRENFEWICAQRPKDVIARIPVIPDFNEADLPDLIAYARAHQVKEVHLLPFHPLGRAKWERLGSTYRYQDVPMMSREHLQAYAAEDVKIGGQ